MKKKCIYIFLLFFPLISIGQIQLGVKGGYSYFWFSNYQEGGPYSIQFTYPNNAYLVAITARQRSEHKFNLGMELQYVHRSFAVKASNEYHMSISRVDFNYTVGSLLLQIQPQFVFGSKVKFFIYPGVYFGTLLHSTINGTSYSLEYGIPTYSKTDTIHGSAKNYYPGLEFGISPGLGIEFPVYKNLNFVIEYNFCMSLNSFGKSWGNYVRMYNMNFEVGLAYTFQTANP